MQKIKIATDSTADIPANMRDQLGIEVLPLTIIHEGKEYKDGYDLTSEQFFNILDTSDEVPTSSCITPVLFTELYEKTYNEGYTDLILTLINSKGSSTFQGALMMRDAFYEDNPEAKDKLNIHLIDSRTYSLGYGWAVMEAAKMAAKGASVDEIKSVMQEWLDNVRPVFLPANLKFVKKSGRISAAAAFVGDALGLKPVITFENGESKIISKIRGEKKAIKEFVDIIEKERKPGTPYILITSNNKEKCEQLRTACIERLGQEPEFSTPVGCIISINTGPDFVGIIYRR